MRSSNPLNDLYDEMVEYTRAMVDGSVPVNHRRKQAAERCLKNLEDPRYFININTVFVVIYLMETTFKHIKGIARGQPFTMELWEKWIVFNLVGFELKESPGERRFKEAFIYIPRKNSKTFFASALAWALALLEKENNATLYIIATKLDRAREAFDNICENLYLAKEDEKYRILDNNSEHSITRTWPDNSKIKIQALAADAKRADGLNANIIILDEIHGYKSANDYYVYRQAMSAYVNKLLIGITTAGSNQNSFCYEHLTYCKKVLDGLENEQLFIFICEADDPDDYLNPYQHQIANPNYGITVRPEDMKITAQQAKHSSSGQIEFLNKNLNIYVDALEAYFDTQEFILSDAKFNWSLEELSKLKIKWYGGVDLSKMHDLTAVSLYGRLQTKEGDIDICISHGFIPRTEAIIKAEKSNIPVFGWQDKEELTIQNTPTVHYADVVKWFKSMKKKGFKPVRVGYDPKFASEFALEMKRAGFKMIATPQKPSNKSQGFRRIERQAKESRLYYNHSEPFLYCVGNVKAIEDEYGFVKYSKLEKEMKIDYFDASVMACYEMLQDFSRNEEIKRIYGNKKTNGVSVSERQDRD